MVYTLWCTMLLQKHSPHTGHVNTILVLHCTTHRACSAYSCLTCLSVCLPAVCLSVCQSACLQSACLFVSLFVSVLWVNKYHLQLEIYRRKADEQSLHATCIWLSVWLSVWLSAYLPVCLSVCLCCLITDKVRECVCSSGCFLCPPRSVYPTLVLDVPS